MMKYKKKSLIASYPSGRTETYRCANRTEEKEKRKALDKAVRAGALTYYVKEDQ